MNENEECLGFIGVGGGFGGSSVASQPSEDPQRTAPPDAGGDDV